jgi:hypothetical protein
VIGKQQLFDLQNGVLICLDKDSKLHFSNRDTDDFALIINNSNHLQVAEVIWLKTNERRQIHYTILQHFKVIQNV